MANKHMNWFSTSLANREMQNGITVRYYYIPTKKLKVKNKETRQSKCWQDYGVTGTVVVAGGNAKLCSHFAKHF